MLPDISAVLSAIGATAATEQAKEQAQAQSLANPETQAKIIKEAFAPAVLAAITSKHLGVLATTEGFQVLCDQYLAGCGSPTDPVEIMLLQQLLWSHHRTGALLAEAAAAKSPEMVETYSTAAAKLMSEHRRSSLALHQYRAPVLARQVTVVKNVARGDQHVAVVQGDGASRQARKKTADNELGSKNGEQSVALAPTGCGEAQPAEARKPHGRGANAAA